MTEERQLWIDGVRRILDRADGVRAGGALVIRDRQPELLEIIRTLGAAGRLAGRLHGRQEQCDENGDDGDDHQ